MTGVIDTNRPIDYEQLYAQAMYELEHGERYWFDQEEEKIMVENNREFEQVPPEEQLFFRYFRPSGDFGRYSKRQFNPDVCQEG